LASRLTGSASPGSQGAREMVPRFRGCVSGLRRPVSSSRARARRQRARGDVGGAVPTRVRGRDGCGRRCADGRPLLLTRGSDRPQPHSVGWPAVRAGCLSLSSSLPDRAHRWALPMQPRRRAHTELASARDEKERRDGALVAPLVSRDSTGRGSERRPRGPASAFVGQAAAPRGLGRRRPRVCLVAAGSSASTRSLARSLQARRLAETSSPREGGLPSDARGDSPRVKSRSFPGARA
jgi:hypothetical protein